MRKPDDRLSDEAGASSQSCPFHRALSCIPFRFIAPSIPSESIVSISPRLPRLSFSRCNCVVVAHALHI